VLRYFSLANKTVVLYYTKGILQELNMTQTEFREICVLSGTDYNINATNLKQSSPKTIYDIIKMFRKYQQQPNKTELSFYSWLKNREKNMELDFDLLNKINNMFIISDELTNLFKNVKIINSPVQQTLVREIMKEDGFMFIN
jgi:hypothetical protein